MGIFENKIHLALVAIVGAAIIGMFMAPSFAANGQTDTPVQFPAPRPPGAQEETSEEEPALGEEAPAPGEEPLLGEEAPLPEEEPLPAPAPLPEEAPALGEEPEELAPEEEEAAPEEVEGETFTVIVEVTFASEAGITTPAPGPTAPIAPEGTAPAPEAVPPTPEEIVPPAPTTPEATPPGTAPATPTITLDITSGAAGSTVNVEGSGFNADSSITLMFDGADAGAAPATAAAAGAFTASLTIPADAAAGPHDMTAQDDTGNSASTSFSVAEAAPAPETTTPEETASTVPEETAPPVEATPTIP